MPDVKRTISVPTSPRSPTKLPDELELLQEFENKVWNKETQTEFAEKLAKSEFFEGEVSKTEPDFSARDRINRAPKTFGFVRFDDNRKIKITDAGKQLIAQKRLEELFLRQLLKWQYPSPNHSGDEYKSFNIKPFLELLRIARDLDGITKRELSIFLITLIDYRNYEKVKNEILEFRGKLNSLRSQIDRKKFIMETHIKKIEEIYKKEIKEGTIKLRERKGKNISRKDFVETKLRNCIDYADAAIRYSRATGLFTISSRTYRLKPLEYKKELIDYILKNFERKPVSYQSNSEFLDFLGDNRYPLLPSDNKNNLVKEIQQLKILVSNKNSEINLEEFIDDKLVALGIEDLKDKREKITKILENENIRHQLHEIHSFNLYPDIIDTFNKINNRTDMDIPDKPLFFEWNTWRALEMLDDGQIKPNFKMDTEGKPISDAPGKMPDIICYYKDFVLVVEVTLTDGATQYDSESEPIPRHLGGIKKELREKGDKRPVFGLFLARNINEATIALFYLLRRQNITFYGGKTNFIPVDIDTFIKMLEIAKNKGRIKSNEIFNFLKKADAWADKAKEESKWYEAVVEIANNFLTLEKI